MIIRHNPQVVSKKIGAQWIILESNRKYVRSLNTTAGYIWSITKNPVSIDNIVKKTSTHFKTPIAQVRKDVEEFVKKYLHEDLLTTT